MFSKKINLLIVTLINLIIISSNVNAYDVSINGSEYLEMEALIIPGGSTTQLIEYDYTTTPSTIRFHVSDPLVCTSKTESTSITIITGIQDANGLDVVTNQNNIVSAVYDFANNQINIDTDDTLACATKMDAANNVVTDPDLLFGDSFENLIVPANDDLKLFLLKVTSSTDNTPLTTEPFSTGTNPITNDQMLEYQYILTNTGSITHTADFVEYVSLISSDGPILIDPNVTSDDWYCTVPVGSNIATVCGTTADVSGVATVRLDNAEIAAGDSLEIFVRRQAVVDANDITLGLTIDLLASLFIIDAGVGNLVNSTVYQEFISSLVVATKVVMTSQPTNAVAGATIGNVEIQLQDDTGALDTNNSSNVTISIVDNPSAGTLGGTTLTIAAVNGIATFTDLFIDKVGVGYTIMATSGSFSTAASNSFDISAGVATQLAVTTQPVDTLLDVFIPVIEVQAQDIFGNLDATFTNAIFVNKVPGSGSGSISGVTALNAVGGIASFNDLSIDIVGTYSLFFSTLVSGVISNSFEITAIPDATMSEYGVDLNSQIAGTDVTYSALINDAAGNHVNSGIEVTFNMSNSGGAVTPTVSCFTNSLGICSVTATSTIVGTTDVSPSVDGNNIAAVTTGLHATTTWQAGAPDAATSNFWVDSAASNINSNVNMIAELKDQYGNLVAGIDVVFSLTDSGGAITPNLVICTVPTNSAGKCKITVTSSTAGSTSISASFDLLGTFITITNPNPPAGFGRVINWQ